MLCLKVGAPTEIASLLEEIGRETHQPLSLRQIGDDPDLDHFMVLIYYYFFLFSLFNSNTNFLYTIGIILPNSS